MTAIKASSTTSANNPGLFGLDATYVTECNIVGMQCNLIMDLTVDGPTKEDQNQGIAVVSQEQQANEWLTIICQGEADSVPEQTSPIMSVSALSQAIKVADLANLSGGDDPSAENKISGSGIEFAEGKFKCGYSIAIPEGSHW